MASSVGKPRLPPQDRMMFDMLRRLEHMYEMAVWDASGRMYMPLYGYDGRIEAYTYAIDAIEMWNADFLREQGRSLL